MTWTSWLADAFSQPRAWGSLALGCCLLVLSLPEQRTVSEEEAVRFVGGQTPAKCFRIVDRWCPKISVTPCSDVACVKGLIFWNCPDNTTEGIQNNTKYKGLSWPHPNDKKDCGTNAGQNNGTILCTSRRNCVSGCSPDPTRGGARFCTSGTTVTKVAEYYIPKCNAKCGI
jgi:hypothetical protein